MTFTIQTALATMKALRVFLKEQGLFAKWNGSYYDRIVAAVEKRIKETSLTDQ